MPQIVYEIQSTMHYIRPTRSCQSISLNDEFQTTGNKPLLWRKLQSLPCKRSNLERQEDGSGMREVGSRLGAGLVRASWGTSDAGVTTTGWTF